MSWKDVLYLSLYHFISLGDVIVHLMIVHGLIKLAHLKVNLSQTWGCFSLALGILCISEKEMG